METVQERRPPTRNDYQNVRPLIQLAGSDSAPVINYNVPEPTTYTGRHALELRISPIDEENNKMFNMDAFTDIPSGEAPVLTIETVTAAMTNGFSDDKLFPLVRPYAGLIRLVGSGTPENPYQIVSNQDLSTELRNLHPQEVFSAFSANKNLMIYRTMFGSLSYRYIEAVAGTTIPGGRIINPGEPVEGTGPGNIVFSLTSPGNNAEWVGPPPGYRILINGAISSQQYPFPEQWTVHVQVGSGPLVIARLVKDNTEIKWSAEYGINTAGWSSITAILYGPISDPGRVTIHANMKTSFSGQMMNQIRPRLLLLESYRLESHLGQYGAGRIIKTFTLLPGEKTTISTRTYTRTETDAKRASSVLDSVTEESTREFENSLSTEQSDKKNYQESFSYEINAKAQAVWGWGSANVSGQVRGATESAHEEFAKNISNAAHKHASTASSKRDVQINTSYEEKRIEEAETSIEREVQNINVSRTLNFVFRQMNQEYITALCLVDARVAVWDGNPDPATSVRVEVALPDLDSLLERFVVEDRRKEMREAIVAELSLIYDYNGNPVIDFIEDHTIYDRSEKPARTYWRVNPKKKTDYVDPITNEKRFTVQGILVKADRHVMRTDGIWVEALLGAGNALDNYSESLQNESIRARELENQLKETEVRKNRLAISTVDKGPKEQVERFERIFPCCKPTIFSLWPPKDNDEQNG